MEYVNHMILRNGGHKKNFLASLFSLKQVIDPQVRGTFPIWKKGASSSLKMERHQRKLKENGHVYVWLSHFVVDLKPSQHCQSAMRACLLSCFGQV